jgi:hypothetical protein
LVLVVVLTASHAAAQSSDHETTTSTAADTEAPAADASDDEGEDVVASLGSAIGEPALGTGPGVPTGSQHRLAWREEWPRYSFDEAVLSLGLGAMLLAAGLLPTATTRANWTDVNALDGAVRDGLRLNLAEQRDSARVAGDVLMWIDMGIPFVVDALFATGIGDGSWDASLQMGLISLEAYVVSLVVWRVTSLLARRERPVTHDCNNPSLDPAHNPSASECAANGSPQGYFSNTAVNAFTGAGLTCLHHTTMPVFGDEGADATACVGALTVAAVAGLLRIMSNLEYLTDVLTGAVVGLVSGWLLPWLLHYQGGARPELRPALAAVPVPMVGAGNTIGLDVVGWF